MVKVEHLNDVGMAKLSYGGSFFLKAAYKLGVAGQVRVDQLYRNGPPQIGIVGFVDGGHSALSQQ
jgi:hypothetical protein